MPNAPTKNIIETATPDNPAPNTRKDAPSSSMDFDAIASCGDKAAIPTNTKTRLAIKEAITPNGAYSLPTASSKLLEVLTKLLNIKVITPSVTETCSNTPANTTNATDRAYIPLTSTI